MNCPNDNEQLEKAIFFDTEIDYCPKCLGIWFDDEELKTAKNAKDKDLNWLDVDLWRDKKRFEVIKSSKFCPVCRIGLQEIKYDQSKTKVDFCKKCRGVWLDRGEFKQIINYLKHKSDYDILHRYVASLSKEAWEVFTGPESLREELADIMTLLKLFNYKFVVQHPLLNSMIENSQK